MAKRLPRATRTGTIGDPAVIQPVWKSTLPDTGDPNRLGPNAWNAERFVAGGNDGDVIVRDASSPTGGSWLTLATPATPADVAAGDAATLASANAHADAGDAATLQQVAAGDGATLTSAKQYADTGDAATLASAKAYSDAKPAGVRKLAAVATPIPLPIDAPNTDVDLWTKTLPAGQVAAAGDTLRIQCWGQFVASTSGSRTITLALGAVVLGTITYSGSALKPWTLNTTIIRAAASGQQAVQTVSDGSPSLVADVLTPAIDWTTAQTIAIRGRQGGKPATPQLQVTGILVLQW
jgi:hypothetical protein